MMIMMIMMMMIIIIITLLATLSALVSDQRTLWRSWARGVRQQSAKGGEIIYFNLRNNFYAKYNFK